MRTLHLVPAPQLCDETWSSLGRRVGQNLIEKTYRTVALLEVQYVQGMAQPLGTMELFSQAAGLEHRFM